MRSTVLAAGFVLAWSSGFIGARLGTDAADAATVLMWRFLLAAALLIAWCALWRRRRLTRREIGLQSVVGLLSQGVYLGGIVLAVQLGVGLGTTALIAALQPVLAGALAGPVLGEHVRREQWLGLAIGVAGVALVVGDDLQAQHVDTLWAYALPFVAMAGLVAATLLERRSALDTPVVEGLTIQCVVSAILFSAAALVTGTETPPHDDAFWVAIAWFIVFSTVGGYGLYWVNVKRSGITRVSSLLYLTPPATMVWAFLMFGDTIGALGAAGILVCLVAVVLVVRRPSSGPSSPGRLRRGRGSRREGRGGSPSPPGPRPSRARR